MAGIVDRKIDNDQMRRHIILNHIKLNSVLVQNPHMWNKGAQEMDYESAMWSSHVVFHFYVLGLLTFSTCNN